MKEQNPRYKNILRPQPHSGNAKSIKILSSVIVKITTKELAHFCYF